MRLLNARTKILEEFIGDNIPEYAILSHTWGPDELTYGDFVASGCLPLNLKIGGCCSTALDHDLEHVWIDTICIDKSSSAELSEAINSMYEWYKKAKVCFAYLSDVSCNASTPIADIASSDSDFCQSRWFTRGWTLQELIAPSAVSFFNNQWELIGHKRAVFTNRYLIMLAGDPVEVSILTILRQITNIPLDVLAGQTDPTSISVARRMMWAAKRQTTRREDTAYCLLGLFNINMTMLYGEGDQAFRRLQEEIVRTSDDESIFAWGFGRVTSDALQMRNCPIKASTLLASSPADFVGCKDIRPLPSTHSWRKNHATHYLVTNKGLLIERPIIALPRDFNTSLLPLNCCVTERATDHMMMSHSSIEERYPQVLALPLRGVLGQDARLQVYQACRVVMVDIALFEQTDPSAPDADRRRIYVDMSPQYFGGWYYLRRRISLYVIEHLPASPVFFNVLETYSSWSYFPNTEAAPGTSDFVGVLTETAGIGSDAEPLTPHTIIRIRCSNNKHYLLRFYPIPPKDDPYISFLQRTGLDWGLGILSDDPGDPVLRRILRATPGSELSTTFIGPCPTVSDDGYVRVGLEVIEPPSLGGFGGNFSLTIRCGGQEESSTKEMEQSSAKTLQS